MERARVTLAIILSATVLIAWPLLSHYFFPKQAPEVSQLEQPAQDRIEQPEAAAPEAKAQATTPRPAPQAQQVSLTTQEAQRDVVIETPYWRAKFSNRGAVATSWILKRRNTDSASAEIKGADGHPLQLIPQDVIDRLGAPLRFRLPWSPELTTQLNQVNFRIEGAQPGEELIQLDPGQQRQISFIYSSPALTARKTLTLYGDTFLFDITAEVIANGQQQPAEIVIGPRIADQSEKQSASTYNTPPQVVAHTGAGKREQIPAANITSPFAKIVSLDQNRIEIDKPLAGDVDAVKIVSGDGATFIGYARVVSRDASSRSLTLDALPEGTIAGNGVAQATDTLRHGYLWAGIVSHYFTMVAIPSRPVSEIVLTNVQIKHAAQDEASHDYPSVAVPVASDSITRIFVGPKDRQLLAQVGAQLGADIESLIDYGMFSAFIRPIVPAIGWALEEFAKVFHNYGWAIVAVTVIINLALSPLRWYSSKKMKKAAKHQPRMKELQDRMKKLKENPKKYEREMQQLQREQMDLMKEANPLGGCLPLLLQMPIFWAFFVYLTISLDVRQAHWMLWIKDLATPDPYHILPIVMCVTMIASTMLTPQPAQADPAMKMQRVMMTWLMPIVLTWFFFFSAPSGLVLYWMVSNLVGVGIQLVVNRVTAEPVDQTAAVASGQSAKANKKGEAVRKQKASKKEIVEGVK